jgi:micrococcal nuclease
MRFVQATPAFAWILAGLVLGPVAGLAETPGAVTVAAGGADELRLVDGRRVRLAGIYVPPGPDGADDPAARDAIDGLIDGAPVTLESRPPPLDRHGRLRVQVHGADGAWLQGELVRRGLALAAPAPDVPDPLLAELLGLERAARAAKRGLWAGDDSGPWPAERVAAERGRYLLVRGRVRQVARAQDFVYLNFGEDWHHDFTVRAEARQADRFAKAGLDLQRLEGRTVEVRGLLFEANGPMIELAHPAQLVILE